MVSAGEVMAGPAGESARGMVGGTEEGGHGQVLGEQVGRSWSREELVARAPRSR